MTYGPLDSVEPATVPAPSSTLIPDCPTILTGQRISCLVALAVMLALAFAGSSATSAASC